MQECVDATCFKPCGEKIKNVKKSLSVSRISHRIELCSSCDAYKELCSSCYAYRKSILV